MAVSQARILLAAAVVVSLASAIEGQDSRAGNPQNTRGALFGVVKDAAGAVLPGVTVAAAGPALPQPRTVMTDSVGSYYLPELPPGTYTVAFTLAGFFPVTRDSVVITSGARLGLNVALAGAGTMSAATPAPGLKPGEVLVRLETQLGNIDVAVDTAHAPITAANFLKYVDGGFYDGGRFHRVTRPDNYTPAPPNRPMMEIIQGGINPARDTEKFPPIPLERTSVTGLKHVAGAISMARNPEADTATSDFFILLDNQPSLDFGGRRFDDGQGAAAFGRVAAGLDVVRKIQQQPIDPNPTNKQNLKPPVTITRAARMK
jgi:peptidyl-prolyl cis-trans isomerase A (cyclophilin A)